MTNRGAEKARQSRARFPVCRHFWSAAIRVLGIAQPVGIREANGFGNEWKPGGLPEPNPTEPAGETGFAAHPICGLPEPNPDRARRRDAPFGRVFLPWFAPGA